MKSLSITYECKSHCISSTVAIDMPAIVAQCRQLKIKQK